MIVTQSVRIIFIGFVIGTVIICVKCCNSIDEFFTWQEKFMSQNCCLERLLMGSEIVIVTGIFIVLVNFFLKETFFGTGLTLQILDC